MTEELHWITRTEADIANGVVPDVPGGAIERVRFNSGTKLSTNTVRVCSWGRALIHDGSLLSSWITAYAVTRDQFIAMKLPGGKRWDGGDSAPGDWDGGDILLSDGFISDRPKGHSGLEWRHLCVGENDGIDIIAYLPTTQLAADTVTIPRMTEAEAMVRIQTYRKRLETSFTEDMVDLLRSFGILTPPDRIGTFLAAHPDASPHELLVAWEAAK